MLCLVTQSCPTLCGPVYCSPPGSSVHRDSLGKNTRVGCCLLLQGIFPTQGSNLGLPALQADSLPSEPPGKPKNTGVPIPSPGGLPNPGIEPGSPVETWLLADSLPPELPEKPKLSFGGSEIAGKGLRLFVSLN